MRIDEILFHVPCPIFWKDLTGVFLGCNKLFLPISGLNNYDDLIGKTDIELPWKKFTDEYAKDDQYVISTGETLTKIEDIILNDQLIMISETTKTPLIQNGEIIGVLGICLDITNKKEKERLEAERKINLERLKTQSILNDCMDNIQSLLQEAKIKILNNKAGTSINTLQQDVDIVLTKRERQVLYFLSMGKSPKAIAEILGKLENKKVESSTIGGLINKQLYPKFNVFNRGQLIEKAQILKLIPFLHEILLTGEME